MRKIVCAILCLTLLAPCLGAAAQEETPRQTVSVRLYEEKDLAWSCAMSREGVLAQQDDQYVPDDPEMATGGARVWTFEAAGEGEVTLTFSREGGDETGQSRSYTYAVDADGAISFVSTDAPTTQIRLSENPTTGYEWSYAMEDEGVAWVIGDGFLPDDGTGEMLGAGGTRVWTIAGIREGEARLACKYARPWETDAQPEAEVTFLVTVAQDLSVSVRVDECDDGADEMLVEPTKGTDVPQEIS